jgi:predicted AAA+ superfamily ATPase
MSSLDDFVRFNPWWRTGQVRDSLLKEYRREGYSFVSECMNRRQIILLWGLRRIGKTTLMYQVIQDLLSTVRPQNVLYYSFDEAGADLKEVLETYQKQFLNKNFEDSKDRVYLFLDEIQKVGDWENKLKTYYDLYPNVKFFVSGSASVSLRKKSSESLAGRICDYQLPPLSFQEFLELSGKKPEEIKKNPKIWEREILPLFYKYFRYGMFPELVNEENEEQAKKYIISLVERIIYKDIPEEFPVKDVELLRNIAYLVCLNPGQLVNYKEISKNLGRDQRTVANYFEYLEFSLLIGFAHNYRGSTIASMRKLKKAYPATPNITYAFSSDPIKTMPAMLENLVFTKSKAKYFYRNGFEVDFIIPQEKGVNAIEVKTEEKDIRQIKKLRDEYGKKLLKSTIIDFEKEGKIEDVEIKPAWKYLLDL